MKILLALPLLALLGVALSEEVESITSRLCTKGHCIECANGNCKETRGQFREGYIWRRCVNYDDGQEICKICEHGGCRDSRLQEHEKGLVIDYDPHRSCANGVCIVCKEGVCRDENPIRSKRALDGSYYRSCSNGECVECENRDCKYTRQA